MTKYKYLSKKKYIKNKHSIIESGSKKVIKLDRLTKPKKSEIQCMTL